MYVENSAASDGAPAPVTTETSLIYPESDEKKGVLKNF